MSTKEKNTLIDVVKKQGVQKIQQALELIDFEKSESKLKALEVVIKEKVKSEDEDLLPEAEDKLNHLMMLWESDIDEIIPDEEDSNSIKVTFKTALPLSYYRYMHITKNAKSLLLCLKNTKYGGAWRITMIGISGKIVRCECTSGKAVITADKDGKVISRWQVDWEVGETFKPRYINETAVMVNLKGLGTWCPGKISKANDDGTYDIVYDDDKRSKERVKSDLIQVKFSENMDEKFVYLQKRKIPSITPTGQKWDPERAFFAPIPKLYCSCKEYTLLGVDLVKQTFQADAVFEFRLNEIGRELRCERYVEEYFREYGLDLKNIIDFRSDVISNGSGGKDSVEQIILYGRTRSPSFMFDYTIQCRKQSEYRADKLDMHSFPFDQQELSLSIGLKSSTLHIELEIDSQDKTAVYKRYFKLTIQKEYRILFNDTALKKPWMKTKKAKSEMTYFIFVRRDFSFYIYGTIMPLIMFCLLSFLVFGVTNDCNELDT
eukprot:gene35707-biopygen28226